MRAIAWGCVLACGAAAAAQTDPGTPATGAAQTAHPTRVILMEPVSADTAQSPSDRPQYSEVTDAERLAEIRPLLANDCAERALALYAAAWDTMQRRGGPSEVPPYHVALVPGGNHPDAGFVLATPAGPREHASTLYIKLNPDPDSFRITFLHETGHIALAVLNGGEGVPRGELSSIPHTTSALTDRGTAFDEGFGIFLEAFAAHLTREPELRAQYHRESYRVTADAGVKSEYYRHALDFMTYAQSQDRYTHVRDNLYAFVAACREPDYVRVQLDPQRDLTQLRDANQLLQSEGFYASFFFTWIFRGPSLPAPTELDQRMAGLLDTLAETFATTPAAADTPWLIRIVQTQIRRDPRLGAEMVDVLHDLSRGVFTAGDAAEQWRGAYLAAVRLELSKAARNPIEARRAEWRQATLADPQVLEARLGPPLGCTVAAVNVGLKPFGQDQPLRFDANTAEEGVLRCFPGISDTEVLRWLTQRAERPFAGVADWRARTALRPEVAGGLAWDSAD